MSETAVRSEGARTFRHSQPSGGLDVSGPSLRSGCNISGTSLTGGSLTHCSPSQPGIFVTAVNPSLAQALQDRYLLERELGSGGMATVYLAQDIKHRRQVAVKVLRPELAASVGAERFLQEITTAARFQHPHILPLLDSGEAGGFLYYVMPFVEGKSLRHG